MIRGATDLHGRARINADVGRLSEPRGEEEWSEAGSPLGKVGGSPPSGSEVADLGLWRWEKGEFRGFLGEEGTGAASVWARGPYRISVPPRVRWSVQSNHCEPKTAPELTPALRRRKFYATDKSKIRWADCRLGDDG